MIQVITSEVKEVKPFPKLMKAENGAILLLRKERQGVILKSADNSSIGYYSDNWDTSSFTDYNEPLTIQNV